VSYHIEDAKRPKPPSAPKWPSFRGTSTFVGTSPSGRVDVFVDHSLGAKALQNAKDLVNDSDRVVTANDAIFGTRGGHVSVIVFALGGATDGSGGADHLGCDYRTGSAIEACASYGQSARVSALFEAELSECSMNGNLCGESTGEALSRWCAAVIGNNALADFATAPTWAHRLRHGVHLVDNQPGARSREDRPGDGDPGRLGNVGPALWHVDRRRSRERVA